VAETTQSITLEATGGDASAAEITKAATALNTVTTSSSNLQANFQERFQHIGLSLFAGQALGTIGLSGETRQAVMLMNTALAGAEEAAGITSGGFTLLLTALLAVGAAVYEVIEKHTNLAASLDTVVQSQQTAMQSTQSNIDVINTYGKAVGSLTPAQQSLLDAEKALAAEQKGELLESINQQIAAVKDQMAGNITHAKVMQTVTSAYDSVKNAIMSHIQVLTALFPLIGVAIDAYNLLESAVTKVKSAFNAHTSSIQLSAQATAALAKAQDPLTTKLAELQAEVAAGGQKWQDYYKSATEGSASVVKAADEQMAAWQKARTEAIAQQQTLDTQFSKTIDDLSQKENTYTISSTNQSNISTQKKIANIKMWQSEQEQALQKAYYAEVSTIQASTEDQTLKDQQLTQLSNQFYQSEIALNADANSKMAGANTEYYQETKQVVDQISNDVGKGFADMIVQGTSFSQAMTQMWEQMAEQFIEKVIEMIIEWAALQAIMDIWPGGAAAYTATANAAYPAVSQTAYSGIAQGGAQAEGGTYRVDKPTMFIAGEAGPEIASFTPLSDIGTPSPSGGTGAPSGGASAYAPPSGQSGAGNVTMGDINVTLQMGSLGSGDVNAMLKQLAAAIRTASVDAVRFAVTSAQLADKNSTVAV